MIGRRRGAMYGRRRAEGLGILLLAIQVMRVGLDNIPPVTLASLVANTVIYLRILQVPSIQTVCVSAVKVWHQHEWSRLLLASWFHTSDMHLYFNMASFLWKGMSLERKLGSKYFAYMIAVFSVLTSSLLVCLDILASEVFGDASYLYSCAVGFSAVIFSIKMVTTYSMAPGTQWIMGLIPVHSRIACWVELVLIQVLVPNVSFTGHLAGILVGLAYVKGPLKRNMDLFLQPDNEIRHRGRTQGNRNTWSQRFFGGGTTGTQRQPVHVRNANQYDEVVYTGGLSEDEQLARALHDSSQHTGYEMNHNEEVNHTYEQRARLYPTLPNDAVPSAPPPPGPSAPPLEVDDQPLPYGFTDPTVNQSRRAPQSHSHVDSSRPTEPPSYHFVEQNRQSGNHSNSVIDNDELRRRRLARFDR
ncbi:rhomboid-related protein 4-like [Saccoglossus kowalevskii]|uniref:Rhomboid-related protein 4-like n=1 Tax=Saccoglossus kowalevskii TaxID=10224 RepID=A0ABM0GU85_SACKO|nr:PREDICTED: rhomboid-related protein 4-like [Saccoglossus kowalevskii]